jgi:hypothetical protein
MGLHPDPFIHPDAVSIKRSLRRRNSGQEIACKTAYRIDLKRCKEGSDEKICRTVHGVTGRLRKDEGKLDP